MTGGAVLGLLFVQLVIERHRIDGHGLAGILHRRHEQGVVGLPGFEAGHIGDLLESGTDRGVMTARALERPCSLLGLADLHMAGQAFFVGLLLVLGERQIALVRLVLGVTLGTIFFLAGRGKHHLGRRVAGMEILGLALVLHPCL